MLIQASQQILNRIATGNYLLSTAGPLPSNADPLSVAQAVLVAHDASELILAALAESVGFTSRERTTFMEYVTEIEKARGPLTISLFFKELNGARVSFKHSGILPTAQQFHDCATKARANLDKACRACLGVSIEEVGLEMLIENDAARQLYEESKLYNRQGKFEDALKSLGRCFREALDATPFAYYVEVGKADTEAALHLLGCGVSPSMFLSLQKFLPSVNWGEVTWDLRETGHPGNWTGENVDYCLGVTLKIILQIQHAPFTAHAYPFDVAYEDVLTAKTDGVVVNTENMLFYGHSSRAVGELKKGQEIAGRLTPAYEFDSTGKWEETAIENANLFVISPTSAEVLGKKIEPYERLLIRADLVDVSHRVKQNTGTREMFPHLFERGGADL